MNLIARIYLGTGFNKAGDPIPAEWALRAKQRGETELSERFGGCTVYEARGVWRSEGTLYRESTLVFEVLIGDETQKYRVETVVHYLKHELEQEAVLVTYTPCEAEFI